MWLFKCVIFFFSFLCHSVYFEMVFPTLFSLTRHSSCGNCVYGRFLIAANAPLPLCSSTKIFARFEPSNVVSSSVLKPTKNDRNRIIARWKQHTWWIHPASKTDATNLKKSQQQEACLLPSGWWPNKNKLLLERTALGREGVKIEQWMWKEKKGLVRFFYAENVMTAALESDPQ